MLVKELIEHLKTLDPNLPLGAETHFGIYIDDEINNYDFKVQTAWLDEGRIKTIKYVSVPTPDIGEEPI